MRKGVSVLLYAASYLFTHLITGANANSIPYLQPGFSFEFVGSETTVALPVTAQCETVSLKWSRKSTAKGPAPIAPYFLQVFSSSSPAPFSVSAGSGPTFDWQVPFAPQTQYQICMYDSQGTSGGCRAIRTMVASATTNVSCQNVTSLPQLSASTPTDDQSKPITQPRVISQCSDFSVTPGAGTPPFTLTVAPSRHPPVNITSTGRDAIHWTVSLPEGFPFFASLTSSEGLSWSRGPLYVDGQGPSDCLSPGTLPKGTFTGATAGAGAGGLMIGAGLGVLAMFLILRRKQTQSPAASTRGITISKPTFVPELSHNGYPGTPPPPQQAPSAVQYPPPSIFSQMQSSVPSVPSSPERSHFLHQDPFASVPPSRAQDSTMSMDTSTDSIPEGYSELGSPTSSHFPLDVKRRRSQLSQSHTVPHVPHVPRNDSPSRTPSLRSYTTFASTSYNESSYVPSAHNSMMPLMPSSVSSRSSRTSRRVSRAPTYIRRPPPSHISASEMLGLRDGDSMIGPGDVPPQYMRDPAEQETTVAGGALI